MALDRSTNAAQKTDPADDAIVLQQERRYPLPEYLTGATDFGSTDSKMHSLFVIETARDIPEIAVVIEEIDALCETGGGETKWGRPRRQGSYALAYLAYVYSGLPDVLPWWRRAGHSIWEAAGFVGERPSYSTIQRRFAELEPYADMFEFAASVLIQRAVQCSGGMVGRYLQVDGSEAETHARLHHDCPPESKCWDEDKNKAQKKVMLHGKKKGEDDPRRVTAGESINSVRDERHKLAEGPEPEGDAAEHPLVGEAQDWEFIEDPETHQTISARVKVGGCWYRLLDPTAGVRAYTGPKGAKKFWCGFYCAKATDHFTGAPIAIHFSSASVQEYRAYPALFERAVRNTGSFPSAVSGDRGYSMREVFEYNTTRGVASVFPWRRHGGREDRSDEDCSQFDRHGIPRCKYCGGPCEFVSFTRTAGGNRGPRLYFACATGPFTACHTKRQSIACKEEWRLLLPLWRTDYTYLALESTGKRYERVHHHWRVRYRVGADDHLMRPKRRGIDCQQLRANAALLIEWMTICWREGWLPTGEAPARPRPGTVVADTGEKPRDRLLKYRRRYGLGRPYGEYAIDAGTSSSMIPIPGALGDLMAGAIGKGEAMQVIDPDDPAVKIFIAEIRNWWLAGEPAPWGVWEQAAEYFGDPFVEEWVKKQAEVLEDLLPNPAAIVDDGMPF